jgi:T5orf172 domain
MSEGFLYVLVHPSEPDLYKVGVTVLPPEKRLAQHNRLQETHAGQVVRRTGETWQMKTYISVVDVYWAEKAFWAATPIADIPYRNGVEVERMDWATVLQGLDAASKAGRRPVDERAKRDRNWMIAQLQGSKIAMFGHYRGLVTHVEFGCDKGHVFRESPGLVARLKSCPCCEDWGFHGGRRMGLRASLRQASDSSSEA